MVKSTGQAHTQEGRNERLIDLLLVLVVKVKAAFCFLLMLQG